MAEISSLMPFFDEKVQGAMNLIESGAAYHNPIENTITNQNRQIDDLLTKIPTPPSTPGTPWTYEKYNKMIDSLNKLKVQNSGANNQVSELMSNYTDKVNSVLQASNIDNVRNHVETVDRCKSFLNNYFGIASGALDDSINAAGDALQSIYTMIEGGYESLAAGADAVTNTIVDTTAKLWSQIQEETGINKLVDGINRAFAGGSSLCSMVQDPCVQELAKNTLSDDMLNNLGF